MDITKFDPTVADLQTLVSLTSSVTLTDFKDKDQLENVKKNRILLRDARLKITKRGKELREEAVAFQKAVISKEKELIAIVEPEENRLSAIEEEAKVMKERADRIALLPQRHAKLAEIGDGIAVSDDGLLVLSAEEFQAYCNKRMADKNAAAERALAEREAKLKEAELAIQREKEMRAREEQVREEERQRAEQREKERIEREEREKKLEAERLERERLEEERKEKEAEEKRKQDTRFQAFLSENGFQENDFNFTMIRTNGEVRLYKLLAIFDENE